MKIDINWATASILTLPLAWVIAFLLFLRPTILGSPTFIIFAVIGLLFGLIAGGFITEKVRGRGLILVIIEVILMVIGIAQWILPFDFWGTVHGQFLLTLIMFLFGYAIVLFTIFLNRLVSSVKRGHIAGIVTVVTFFFAGLFSFIWRFPLPNIFASAVTAGLVLLVLLIAFIVQPWKRELQTYMVPGSIRPYAIWWIIFLTAFGLYVWATPFGYRHLFNSFLFYGPGEFHAELVFIGLAGATFVFTFLPDKLGRKLVFNIATLLLGLLCIFGNAQFDSAIGEQVSYVLLVLQAFVIAFIIAVGAWLVWAEIGSVGMKGRRAAFGWMVVGIIGSIVWLVTVTGSFAVNPLLVYPFAATLVLVSIFPLTNAREVLWNERKVEDIDVSVDSRQVTRALRDLEVDTSLRSIEGQIESEITQLAKIKGISKNQARVLREAGYETPEFVARANINSLAQVLSISPEKAGDIIENARSFQRSQSKTRSKSSTKRKTK